MSENPGLTFRSDLATHDNDPHRCVTGVLQGMALAITHDAYVPSADFDFAAIIGVESLALQNHIHLFITGVPVQPDARSGRNLVVMNELHPGRPFLVIAQVLPADDGTLSAVAGTYLDDAGIFG
jgi:hypothetical protein